MTENHYPEEWGPPTDRKLTCVCGDPDPFHASITKDDFNRLRDYTEPDPEEKYNWTKILVYSMLKRNLPTDWPEDNELFKLMKALERDLTPKSE